MDRVRPGKPPLPPHMKCPHCGHDAKVRTSRGISPVYREAMYDCTNTECNHGFVVGLSALRTTRASLSPNPDIFLPLSPPRSRESPLEGAT